jgi:hypothetical protein
MYRRPARDHNYEFWGDQTFYGENPPQAAVLQWLLKKDAGTVQLKITDATGKEVREISGQVLANSNKAGLQAACWDLRVQPLPAAAGGQRGGRGEAGPSSPAAGSQGAQPQAAGQPGARGGGQQANPFGAGCGGGGGAGGGGFGGLGGGGTPGPFVLPGTYTVALVVDGKTVDSKPLKVAADPEVALTALERKKLFDMAMEMHELQRLATQVGGAVTPLNTRLGEISKAMASQPEVPADVKTSVEALLKEVGVIAPKFAQAAGGRGAGGGGRGAGAGDSLLGRIGQAKNGLMGGIWPGEQTMKAYADAKAQAPKAMADANAAIAKAATLSGALAKYKLTLTAPEPVKIPASVGAAKK